MALSFLFGKKKEVPKAPEATPAATLSAIQKLNAKLEMLEKREKFLEQKMTKCVTDAKDKMKRNDKRGALMMLKRKKMYENQLKTYAGAQMNLYQQINALESVSHTADVVDTMREGAAVLTAAQARVTAEDVDDVVADVQDAIDMQNETNEAISRPVGGAFEDDEELMKEFEDLTEQTMEEELMDMPSGVGIGAAAPPVAAHAAAAAPAPAAAAAVPLPAMPSAPTGPVAAPAAMSAEEAELAALEAEMAM